MRGTGVGTSLILVAIGAVLAFGVHLTSTAINVSVVGAILMVVGIIGMIVSFIFLSEVSWWGHPGGYTTTYHDESAITPPHEHRRVETRDIVYEEEEPESSHVVRERHVRH
jgi:hypothetical protein